MLKIVFSLVISLDSVSGYFLWARARQKNSRRASKLLFYLPFSDCSSGCFSRALVHQKNYGKQKSVWNNATNARIVRGRATAIKAELDLIRKNAWKLFSLLLFLWTACLAIFVEPELDQTLSTKSNCHHKHWWFIRCPASSLNLI